MKKKLTKTQKLKNAAFRSVHRNEPSRVKTTRRKHGKKAAQAMTTAIALDKARRKGARIKKP